MQTIHPASEDFGPDPSDDDEFFDDLLDIGDRRRVFLRMVFGVEVDRVTTDSIFELRFDR